MATVRWEPAGDALSLRRDIDRVLSSFFDGGPARRPAQGWVPPIDLVESEDAFVLVADLPGVAADDVAIDVERGVLTLSGARTRAEDRGAGLRRAERSHGSFRRQLSLPDGVDPDEIVASFDRGVLEVRIPKPPKARPRRVSIDVGTTPATIDGPADDRAARDAERVTAGASPGGASHPADA